MRTSLPQVARIASVTDKGGDVRTFVLDLALEAKPAHGTVKQMRGAAHRRHTRVHSRFLDYISATRDAKDGALRTG